MPADEMFESQLRSRGDLAGIFEFDGEVAYFYLYNTIHLDKRKILGAIHMLSGAPDFKEDDIAICWDETESKVGLRIRGELWAAFDSETGTAYGGNYHANGRAAIPSSITARFEPTAKEN